MEERSVTSEKAFLFLFQDERVRTYFGQQLIDRGWEPLLLDGHLEFDGALVSLFYDNILREGEDCYFQWNGYRKRLTFDDIANCCGVPKLQDAPNQQRIFTKIQDYAHVISIKREYHDGEKYIRQNTLRKNQVLVNQWLGTNVLGTSNVSKIYLDGAHILYLLQKNLQGFCIVRQLFKTITTATVKQAPLPLLVYRLMRRWGIRSPYEPDIRSVELASYNNAFSMCDSGIWTPDEMEAEKHDPTSQILPSQVRLGDMDIFNEISDPRETKLIWAGLGRLEAQLQRNAIQTQSIFSGFDSRMEGLSARVDALENTGGSHDPEPSTRANRRPRRYLIYLPFL